jgi:hypothetical protein
MPIFDINKTIGPAGFFGRALVFGMLFGYAAIHLLGLLSAESMRFRDYRNLHAYESNTGADRPMTDFISIDRQGSRNFTGDDLQAEGAGHFVVGSSVMFFIFVAPLSLYGFFAAHAQRAKDAGQADAFGIIPFIAALTAIVGLSGTYLGVFAGRVISQGQSMAIYGVLLLLFIPSLLLGVMKSCRTCQS